MDFEVGAGGGSDFKGIPQKLYVKSHPRKYVLSHPKFDPQSQAQIYILHILYVLCKILENKKMLLKCHGQIEILFCGFRSSNFYPFVILWEKGGSLVQKLKLFWQFKLPFVLGETFI